MMTSGLLSKAFQTLKFKTRTLGEEQLAAFDALSQAIEQAVARHREEESAVEGEDVPDEFLDPVMFELMKDPVLVPTR